MTVATFWNQRTHAAAKEEIALAAPGNNETPFFREESLCPPRTSNQHFTFSIFIPTTWIICPTQKRFFIWTINKNAVLRVHGTSQSAAFELFDRAHQPPNHQISKPDPETRNGDGLKLHKIKHLKHPDEIIGTSINQ